LQDLPKGDLRKKAMVVFDENGDGKLQQDEVSRTIDAFIRGHSVRPQLNKTYSAAIAVQVASDGVAFQRGEDRRGGAKVAGAVVGVGFTVALVAEIAGVGCAGMLALLTLGLALVIFAVVSQVAQRVEGEPDSEADLEMAYATLDARMKTLIEAAERR